MAENNAYSRPCNHFAPLTTAHGMQLASEGAFIRIPLAKPTTASSHPLWKVKVHPVLPGPLEKKSCCGPYLGVSYLWACFSLAEDPRKAPVIWVPDPAVGIAGDWHLPSRVDISMYVGI